MAQIRITSDQTILSGTIEIMKREMKGIDLADQTIKRKAQNSEERETIIMIVEGIMKGEEISTETTIEGGSLETDLETTKVKEGLVIIMIDTRGMKATLMMAHKLPIMKALTERIENSIKTIDMIRMTIKALSVIIEGTRTEMETGISREIISIEMGMAETLIEMIVGEAEEGAEAEVETRMETEEVSEIMTFSEASGMTMRATEDLIETMKMITGDLEAETTIGQVSEIMIVNKKGMTTKTTILNARMKIMGEMEVEKISITD